MFRNLCLRCICFVLVSSTTLSATEIDVPALQKKIYSTIEDVTPAVVSISLRGRRQLGGFSGVIVSKDGHVLSAGHAVRPGGKYEVLLPDGRSFNAVGKGSNGVADCALLQITSDFEGLPYAQMGESKSLVKNQPCLSISYPSGQRARLAPVVRFGHLVRDGGGTKMLQSTALMEPGDSGGPLFDLNGRVIGIHSRITEGMEQNFEVPIDTFKKFWNELNREKGFTHSGPSTPTLGFRGTESKTGVTVGRIQADSLAEKHGIKTDDVIESVHGVETKSMRALRKAMVTARDDEAKEILVKILRDEEQIELKIPFEVVDDSAPEVKLPEYEDKEFPKPTAMEQLAKLPEEFSELESELDDACVDISSTRTEGNKELSIIGTRIKATRFIISKNSMVGDKPTVGDIELEVVSRDEKNDLVLLKTPDKNAAGVDINQQDDAASKTGSFLITPDSDGAGLVSVISSKSFASKKNKRSGFLGVRPADYKDKGGAVLEMVVNGGAAKRAGLEVGDIVTKLNETVITDQLEMREFLTKVKPGSTVIATITRDDEEMEKTIELGEFTSGHSADRVSKSARRDGFTKVILHDADLKPADCGSPVFDLKGNFVGLNIARNSRVRSYLIPRTIVKKLVETAN